MNNQINVLEHRFLQREINPTGFSSSGGSGIDIILSLITWKDLYDGVQRYQLRLLTHKRGYDSCDDLHEELLQEFAPCYERGVWNPNYANILGQIPREKWYELYKKIRGKTDFERINSFFNNSQEVASNNILLRSLDDFMQGLWRK